MASVTVLKNIVRNICPGIMGVFSKRDASYTVAKTQAILGELRKGRSFRSHEVFLAEEVFESDFAEALAVFFHEHAHIFGYDGSRSFTDALTQILSIMVRERNSLDQFEAQWNSAREIVARERKVVNLDEDTSLQALLSALDEQELRDILGMVPMMTLKGILNRTAAA